MTERMFLSEERTRNIGQEIIEAVSEIKAGGGRRFHVTPPEDAHSEKTFPHSNTATREKPHLLE